MNEKKEEGYVLCPDCGEIGLLLVDESGCGWVNYDIALSEFEKEDLKNKLSEKSFFEKLIAWLTRRFTKEQRQKALEP